MDNDDITNDQTEEPAGLLERFDELFEEGGVPKNGTAEVLSGDDMSIDEPSEEKPVQESVQEDAEEATSDDEQEDAEDDATTESDESASTDADEAEETDDVFDKETQDKITDMENDPHPGIKFAELRQQLKEKEQELATIKSEGVNTDEMQQFKLKAEKSDQLESRLKDLESRLSVVDFESTPEFARQVLEPFEEVAVLSETIEKANSLDKDAILNAVVNTDEAGQSAAIERLVEEHNLSRRDETRVYKMADKVLHINAKRDNLEQQATERLEELKQMEVTQEAQTMEQQRTKLRESVKSTFERYEGRLPGFVTDDGKPNEAWTKMQSEALDVDLSDYDDQAHAIFAANALPSVLEQVSSLSKELKEKNLLLSRMTKAKPKVSTPSSPTQKSDSNDSDTFMDRLAKFEF